MKTIKILFILSTLIIFSCSSDLSYEQKVKNYNFCVHKSDSLLKNKEFLKSYGYSVTAIEINDTLAYAIYLKGLASYELNWLEEAEEDFSDVIEIQGDISIAYKNRAKVYLKMEDSDFLDDINIHIKNYPNDEEALRLKRDYLENKEDYDEAITEYNLAINKDKNNINLLTKRADLYYKNGDYEKSIQDYEQILKLNPDNENIKTKKDNILSLINKNSNRNILILIIISIYLIYIAISIFIFKPKVNKKAISQIGGEFEISKDPLIWILPIILGITFFTLLFTNSIPNF